MTDVQGTMQSIRSDRAKKKQSVQFFTWHGLLFFFAKIPSATNQTYSL